MRQKLHEMHLVRRTDLGLEALARGIHPLLRGWIRYYGLYYKSVLRRVLTHLNWILVQWVHRKYKQFRGHPRQAAYWLRRIARRQPGLFAHWQAGIVPSAQWGEPDEPRGSRPVL